MNIKRSVIIFVLCLTIFNVLVAQQRKSPASEQLLFTAEDEHVKKPIPIPDDILAILRDDDLVRSSLENEGVSTIPTSWFSASAIGLRDHGVKDLVLVGEGPLHGTNVTTFWVFRSKSDSHELVLTAPAHTMAFKKTRSKGYRNIELTSATARQISTVIYQFDGKQYRKVQSKIKQME
jgi:hypothetical protein